MTRNWTSRTRAFFDPPVAAALPMPLEPHKDDTRRRRFWLADVVLFGLPSH